MDEADRSCGRGTDPQGIQVQDGHSARYSSLQVNDRLDWLNSLIASLCILMGLYSMNIYVIQHRK